MSDNKYKDNKRVVAVIQARMGSTRFPGKMTRSLAGTPVIDWLLARVSGAQTVDEVMLATSASSANDVLEKAASRRGIRTIRGDENNVLSRYLLAAEESDAGHVVRVCGDNPFVDPGQIDLLVNFFFANPESDYAFNHVSRLSNSYSDGFGAEILSRETLVKVGRLASTPAHLEHVTSYIWEHPESFHITTFPAPVDIAYPSLGFDLDTPEDLARLQYYAKIVGMEGSAADFVRVHLARTR